MNKRVILPEKGQNNPCFLKKSRVVQYAHIKRFKKDIKYTNGNLYEKERK